MIIDTLNHAQIYYSLGERFETALKWLESADISSLAPGWHEIDGDEIYAVVQEYNTAPRDTLKAEAHKIYADIQYVYSGKEQIGYGRIEESVPMGEPADGKDVYFYEPVTEYLNMPEGVFSILFPQDVHTPKCMMDEAAAVKKVVVKVKI